MRSSISLRRHGRSIFGSSLTFPLKMRSRRSWQSFSVRSVPPWNGSTSRGCDGSRTRTTKWPGRPTPSTSSPARRATSMKTVRQGDRDAGAAIDHVVEVAVAGVVVLLDVAAEALLLEQVAVERHDRALGARLVVEPLPERDAHLVEAHQVGADVEVGVLLGRDEQGRLREVQLAVGPGEDVLEPVTGGLERIRPHGCHHFEERSIPAAKGACGDVSMPADARRQASGRGASPSASRTRGLVTSPLSPASSRARSRPRGRAGAAPSFSRFRTKLATFFA